MKTKLFIIAFVVTVVLGGCFLSNARAEETAVKEAEPATFDFLANES